MHHQSCRHIGLQKIIESLMEYLLAMVYYLIMSPLGVEKLLLQEKLPWELERFFQGKEKCIYLDFLAKSLGAC